MLLTMTKLAALILITLGFSFSRYKTKGKIFSKFPFTSDPYRYHSVGRK